MREKLTKHHVEDGEETIEGKEEAFLEVSLIYYINTLFFS